MKGRHRGSAGFKEGRAEDLGEAAGMEGPWRSRPDSAARRGTREEGRTGGTRWSVAGRSRGAALERAGCGVGRCVGGRGGGLSPGEEVGRAREGKESWAAGLG